MTAKEIMTTRVLAVDEDDYARHAVKIMADNNISGLPVVNDSQALVGIITERDLLLMDEEKPPVTKTALYGLWWQPSRIAEEEAQRRGVRVRDVMTKKVVTFGPDDSVREIARVMREREINRVPIVENSGIVGIISRGDIIRALAEGKSLD